jgi:serine/threonine protein kinase
MTLAGGAKLGPYEIVSPVGAGGMGEVYRARDTRLDRLVAIKVLPEAFMADADRRARFEREAQAVAALSHPNILAIHDTGIHAGQTFVVTELLEGETLRDRLRSGGVPVRKAIECALQIARALGAAHAKGIVHRDLKPENVFLLADGQVKLIDFGLARAPADRGTLETVTATEPGTVMGTVGYMAPEQLRGLTVDARADLFALGAVLYEMLSGRPAFKRDTVADTMTAVLNEDPPPLTAVQTDVSRAFQQIVHHALEKNPTERFQSARDFGFALDALSGSATSGMTAVSQVTRPSSSRIKYAAIILIAAALTGSYVFGRHSVPPSGLDGIQFDPKTFEPQFITNARFLPDGQSIVFSAALEGNVPELFVSRPNTLAPQSIGRPHTHLLSVSSQGELAVLTDVKYVAHRLYEGILARMPIDGAPRAWITNVREADWSPDGSSLAVVHFDDRVDRLEYPIGKLLYESAGYLSDPRVSPDGLQVAFCEHPLRFDDRGWLKIVDRSGTVKTLAGEYNRIQGVAWMLDAQRVLFSASSSGTERYQVQVVPASASAPARVALPSMGWVTVHDVSRDGRWIAIRTEERHSIRARLPGDEAEQEFSWMNLAVGPRLSANGRLLLFTDQSPSAGANYAVMYRDTSGGQPVRIGEGNALGLSTDRLGTCRHAQYASNRVVPARAG